MLEARALTYAAGGRTLVDAVDMAVQPGRVTVLIGPNGAGKSTLLRLLSGELAPTRGEVLLDRRRICALTAGQLAGRRAVVPQASVLSFPFTVLEVAMLGATVPGFQAETAAAQSAALAALEAVGMAAALDWSYLHLSGGERQRVHIARALCQLAAAPRAGEGTRCFLLDEPTANLDVAHQVLVLQAIRRQAARGFAVLAIMHDLNLASALADELALLASGRIAERGPPDTVLRDGPLSAAYGCAVHVNRTPLGDRPFVLPPALVDRSRSAD
jgi:iron complex transport system ATP-binding protein